MAERRMFAKTIIDSDMFLDMPLSAQALYFHLSMRADDDGFLNNSQKIIRMINASKNDFDMLLIKKFIIQFDDGVCVIKHWRIHNYIRNDRYKPTMYQEQAKCLTVNSNKSYSLVVENEAERDSYNSSVSYNGIPDADQMDTQERLGKDRLDKNRTGKGSRDKGIKENNSSHILSFRDEASAEENICYENSSKSALSKIISDKELADIILKWNSINVSRIITIKNNRLKALNSRINEYGIDKIFEAIGNIEKSSFLKGSNKRGWRITFDWFMNHANFTKVLEGNYADSVNDKSLQYKNDSAKLKFNNFDERHYDYDSLERKLLGWDKD